MLIFRNALSREVVIGADNKVEQCNYAAVLTRVEAELDNEITGGWKVVEVSDNEAVFANLKLILCRWLDDPLHNSFNHVLKTREKAIYHYRSTPYSINY